MGYRNDQFFNLPTGTETGAEGPSGQRFGVEPGLPSLFPTDNPRFVYPDRVVRTIDQHGTPQVTSLERGYIRSLISSVGQAGFTVRKCGFQFNPATITQSVDQPLSMLNFIQQDPGQYLQPMAGSVNFGFDLMFDRSMEMNNPITTLDRATEDNPWELGDPSQVGVLRDLGALFAVIGQGLSESQKTYVQQALALSLQREQEAGTDISVDKLNTATGALDDRVVDGKSVTGLLNMNIGNSAFLMPLPVRVVFSSLYIVEGLIQSSTVNFLKFNTKMVPMQCTVNISMEAKYIGFAKKKTFLSVALDDAKALAIQTAQEAQALLGTVFTSVSVIGRALEISLSQKQDGEWLGTFNTGMRFIDLENEPFGSPRPGYNTYTRMPFAASDDHARLLQESSTVMTLSDTAKVEVWGPVFGIEGMDLSNPRSAPVQHVLERTAAHSTKILTAELIAPGVSTGDEWDKMEKGAQSKSGYTFTKSAVDTHKYYIAKYTGSITAVVMENDTPQTMKGLGILWEVISPGNMDSYTLQRTVSMDWGGAPVIEDALGSVPATPTTPQSVATAPGTPSAVGKAKAKPKPSNLTPLFGRT